MIVEDASHLNYSYAFYVEVAPLSYDMTGRREREHWIFDQFGRHAYLAEHTGLWSRYWFKTYEQALTFALRWRGA